jgi:hypothetical protein
MPTHQVNLDALIIREDFESTGSTESTGNMPLFKVEELALNRMYFTVLRKPYFQRPTNNWTPEMIVALVESYLDGTLVPALILWHSKTSGKVFIIDGAHRLSALIGWVNDDYGDGPISRGFFGNDIPPAQVKFHKQTQELMEKRVGSYKSLHRAGISPIPSDNPNMVLRGRAIGTLQPDIQKVVGDAEIAESSFLKINTNPATIDPTDFDVIRARKKPNAIATRALMRAGLSYFAKLARAKEIDILAHEVYDIVFGQVVELGTQSPDIPRAGQPYSSEAFKMVLDMVNIFNDVTPAMWQAPKKASKPHKQVVSYLADDVDGSESLKYLERIRTVGTLVSDNGERNPLSLGLDQAVYSYGATGKFHPAAFLASMKFAQELKTEGKLKEFTDIRKDFEEFLVQHKVFINQIGHSKGSRTRPLESVLVMYRTIRDCMHAGVKDDDAIVERLKQESRLAELKDVTNIPSDNTTKRKRFSRSVQYAAVVRTLLENRERCAECGARLPPSCRSKDHIQRATEGGTGSLDNLQFTHPYCNTVHKEQRLSQSVKGA